MCPDDSKLSVSHSSLHAYHIYHRGALRAPWGGRLLGSLKFPYNSWVHKLMGVFVHGRFDSWAHGNEVFKHQHGV